MTEKRHPKPVYLRPWFIVLIVLSALLLALVGPALVRLPGLISAVRSDLSYYRALQSDAAGISADGLRSRLMGTQHTLATLRRDWAVPLGLTQYLGWAPGVGGEIAASRDLLDMADGALAAATELLPALGPALDAYGAGGDPLAALVASVREHPGALTAAEKHLARVRSARSRVNPERLSGRVRSLVAKADGLLPVAYQAPTILSLLPSLMGSDGPRRYLVLAQNSDELRATGGFISGVGVLTLEGGRIKSLTFVDSYTIMDLRQPHPIPPAALETHMRTELLLLRDANWWADFPTSARTAQQLYALDAKQKTDGVIAIDTHALQILVDAIGPVRVEEYNDTITGANLVERMQRYWASPEAAEGTSSSYAAWYQHRKDFMGVLAGSLVKKLLAPGGLNPVKLGEASVRMLRERHLLVYAPSAAELLASQRWDGGIVQGPGDYLMVVDSNVGFNKVNAIVKESISLTVTLAADGSAESELRIQYRHGSSAHLGRCVHEARYGKVYTDMMDRCYWDYLRVFVPKGSMLIGREGLEDGGLAEAEGDRAVLDGLFVLPPGQRQEAVIRFRQPAVAQPYTLYVQKQAGTAAVELRVVVVQPGEQPTVWETDLRQDRQFLTE